MRLAVSQMGRLQEMFDKLIRDAPFRAVAELVEKKLATAGLHLSPEDADRLVSHLQQHPDEEFPFNDCGADDPSITITEEETTEILDRYRNLRDQIGSILQSTIDDVSPSFIEALHERWAHEAEAQAQDRKQFEERLLQRWGPGIQHLRMALTIARDLGESAHASLRRQNISSPHLVDVLSRLHARACQVTEEVVVLLTSGLADGAMARWRTLHEIAVVGFFLKASGERAAERYTAHQAIESFRAATDYRECSAALGYEPIPEEEYLELKRQRDALLERYGVEFNKSYGWAADALGNRNPTIRDIERAAGIDKLRAHYRMASHNVHANPKGIFFSLGLPDGTAALLAGRSDAGLADPGHSCAISLLHITTALCTLEPDLDSLVGLRALDAITHQIGESLGAAHAQMMREAK